MGGKFYLVFDNRGDDVINILNNLVILFNIYNMNVGIMDVENVDIWIYVYLVINKVNIFFQFFEGVREVVGENYDCYVQEVKFVRVLVYYYLNNLYLILYFVNFDVKFVLLCFIVEVGIENNNMFCFMVKQIYEYILFDLENILVLDIEVNIYIGVIYVIQVVVNMFKMRVYMVMNEWDKVIIVGELVIGYSLLEDVILIYKVLYFSQESIFFLLMVDINILNIQQLLVEYYYDGKIMLIDIKSGIMLKFDYLLVIDKCIIVFKGEKDLLMKFMDVKIKLQWVFIFCYVEILLDFVECYVNKVGGEVMVKSLLK